MLWARTTLRIIQCGAWNRSSDHVHGYASRHDHARVIKQRLLEMMPEVKVFLDVDDRTISVLVYCSSKNCMCELVAATKMAKLIIALRMHRIAGGR